LCESYFSVEGRSCRIYRIENLDGQNPQLKTDATYESMRMQ
jgi:hypothetical protein